MDSDSYPTAPAGIILDPVCWNIVESIFCYRFHTWIHCGKQCCIGVSMATSIGAIRFKAQVATLNQAFFQSKQTNPQKKGSKLHLAWALQVRWILFFARKPTRTLFFFCHIFRTPRGVFGRSAPNGQLREPTMLRSKLDQNGESFLLGCLVSALIGLLETNVAIKLQHHTVTKLPGI